MNLFWTVHSIVRARERLHLSDEASLRAFVESVRAKVYAKDWVSYFEYDPRPHPKDGNVPRAIVENLVVTTHSGAAVVRRDGSDYLVVSVLTDAMVAHNATTLWRKTRESLVASHVEARASSRDKAPGLPLKHNPFTKLAR